MGKKQAARKNYGIVRSILPDFCWTPMAGVMLPVAYTIQSDLKFSRATATNVTANKQQVFTMRSYTSTCTGNEPGVGGGIMSGVNLGHCRPATHCDVVLAAKQYIIRNTSQFWMNCAGPYGPPNTVGKLILVNINGKEIAQDITEADFLEAQKTLKEKYPKPRLTDADYERAAKELGIEKNVIKAISEREAPMGGFLPSGNPVVLFEGHVFHRSFARAANALTGTAKTAALGQLSTWARDLPSLVFPRFIRGVTTKNYRLGGEAEYGRFEQALALDRNAAIQGASFGRFQILGEGYNYTRWKTPESFFQAMMESESNQLDAFTDFVRNKDKSLLQMMKDKNWEGIAKRYNGPDALTPGPDGKNYADHMKENYEKLEAEDAKKKKEGVHVPK